MKGAGETMKLITDPSHEALSYVIQKYGDHHSDGTIKGWFGRNEPPSHLVYYNIVDGEPMLRLFGMKEHDALAFIENSEFIEAMAKL